MRQCKKWSIGFINIQMGEKFAKFLDQETQLTNSAVGHTTAINFAMSWKRFCHALKLDSRVLLRDAHLTWVSCRLSCVSPRAKLVFCLIQECISVQRCTLSQNCTSDKSDMHSWIRKNTNSALGHTAAINFASEMHSWIRLFSLYSVPAEHLGAIDHARLDPVGVRCVCFRYLIGKVATAYGVATISRLLKIIGLFCKRAL